MGKRTNVAICILIGSLICAGLIFRGWSDRLYFSYTDQGFEPPQSTFCLHSQIQALLAGIVHILAAVIVIVNSSSIAKALAIGNGKDPSPLLIFIGIVWAGFGLLCFWGIYASYSSFCHVS